MPALLSVCPTRQARVNPRGPMMPARRFSSRLVTEVSSAEPMVKYTAPMAAHPSAWYRPRATGELTWSPPMAVTVTAFLGPATTPAAVQVRAAVRQAWCPRTRIR